MTYSYKQFSDEMFQGDGLYGKCNRMVTLMLLADRMRLSRTKNDKYYDSKMKDFYVIYTQEKMGDKIGYNKKTAGHMYDQLEDSGYIIRKKIGTKKTDKIFLSDKTKRIYHLLPNKDNESNDDEQSSKDDSEQSEKDSDRGENNSNEKEKNSNSEKIFPSSNSYLNKSDVNHRDSISFNNSVNSAQPENEKLSSSQSKDSEVQKETPTLSSLHLESLGNKQARTTKRWIASVNKKLQLDTNVIHSALKISHFDIPKAYHVINLIKNARTNVANDNHLAWNDKRVRFESNQNLGARLADKLLYIFNYAKKKANDTEERSKYFTTSLKEFLKDAFGLSKHRPQVKPKMEEDRESEEIDQALSGSNDSFYISDSDAVNSYDQADNEQPNIPIFKII